MRLNREEFVRFTNAETGIPMSKINAAVDIFTDAVVNAIRSGNDVKLVGFGTFSTKQRAARVGLNPKTKERVNIPERLAVHFEPGSVLRGALGNR